MILKGPTRTSHEDSPGELVHTCHEHFPKRTPQTTIERKLYVPHVQASERHLSDRPILNKSIKRAHQSDGSVPFSPFFHDVSPFCNNVLSD